MGDDVTTTVAADADVDAGLLVAAAPDLDHSASITCEPRTGDDRWGRGTARP